MTTAVKPGRPRARAHVIERPAAIRLLGSPLRQAMLDTISAEGPLTVADLSRLLNRPADRLYYHVKRMRAAGLLVEVPRETPGRPEACFDVAGRPLYIRYEPGAAGNRRAVVRVMEGMLRAARRDFTRSFKPGVEAEGPRRRLWASRVEGTLTDEEIEQLNRLLSETIALVMAGRRGGHSTARTHQVTWVSSPARD